MKIRKSLIAVAAAMLVVFIIVSPSYALSKPGQYSGLPTFIGVATAPL